MKKSVNYLQASTNYMFILVILWHGKYYVDISEIINNFYSSLDFFTISDRNQLSSNLLGLTRNLIDYTKLPDIIYNIFTNWDSEYEKALLYLNELIQESTNFRNNTLIPHVTNVWHHYLTVTSEGFLHNYSGEMFDISFTDGSTYEGHMLDLIHSIAESRHNFQVYGDMVALISQQVQHIENRFNTTLDYEYIPIVFESPITWFITRTHYFMAEDSSTSLTRLYARDPLDPQHFFNRLPILMLGYDNLIPNQTVILFIRAWEFYFNMLVRLYWI